MAENQVKVVGVQDTGNPILDSVVNLYLARAWPDGIESVHKIVLEMAAKEPGGLMRRGKDGSLDLCVPEKKGDSWTSPPSQSELIEREFRAH